MWINKSKLSLLAVYEALAARERGQLPGIPGLNRDNRGQADTYCISRAGVVSQGRSKNQLASMRMALQRWNRAYNDLAFQNVESGKQRGGCRGACSVGHGASPCIHGQSWLDSLRALREHRSHDCPSSSDGPNHRCRLGLDFHWVSRPRQEFPKINTFTDLPSHTRNAWSGCP
jgi:hypothetical protein